MPRTSLPSDTYRNILPYALQIRLPTCKISLGKKHKKTVPLAATCSGKKFGLYFRILPTFQASQPVYVNKPAWASIASDTDSIVATSYNILGPRVLCRHQIITVRDNILTTVEGGNEISKRIDRATWAYDSNKGHSVNSNENSISEKQPLTEIAQTP